MSINEKYSFKDFTGKTFLDVDPDEFSNSEIKGSCFFQENEPDKTIFPAGMVGVQFQRCNLDNVLVLPISTIDERCSNRRIMIQNDSQDWIVDMTLLPIEPINMKRHIREGLNIDPANIPVDLIRETYVTKTEYDVATNWIARTTKGNRPIRDVDFWFKEKPVIIETETKEEAIELSRQWDGVKQFDFDSLPTLMELEVSIVELRRNPNLKLGDIVGWRLTGNVTRYLIRGKAWRFRGE